MNIESIVLEKTFSDFSNEFSKYFDWNDIDLTFFSVDIKKRNTIYHQVTMNGNYFVGQMIWTF